MIEHMEDKLFLCGDCEMSNDDHPDGGYYCTCAIDIDNPTEDECKENHKYL